MREEDAFKELFRILKSRLNFLNKKKKKKQIIDYPLTYSKGTRRGKKVKIGLISDIEGAVNNARRSAQKLKDEDVDFMLIGGDCYENQMIRSSPMFTSNTDKRNQMKRCILPYARLGVKTFIIPGNHENKGVYEDVIKDLEKTNQDVKDMHKKTYITDSFSMVFLGGYHNTKMTDPDGFTIDETDYEWVHKRLKALKKRKKPIILITHGPPLSNGILDFLPFFGNVGDEVLSDMISSFDGDLINLHGHIHEKSGEYYRFSNTISVNISAITNFSNNRVPNTSVLEIEENKIRYREI